MPFRGPNPPPRESEQPNPPPVPRGPFGPIPKPPHRGILGPAGNVPPPQIPEGGPLSEFDKQGWHDADWNHEAEDAMQWDMYMKYDAPMPDRTVWEGELSGPPLKEQMDAWEFGKPNYRNDWRLSPLPNSSPPRPPMGRPPLR